MELTEQQDHEVSGVQLCLQTLCCQSASHRHRVAFGNIPVVKGRKGKTQEWEVSKT